MSKKLIILMLCLYSLIGFSQNKVPFLNSWKTKNYYELVAAYPVAKPVNNGFRIKKYEEEEGDANNNILARWQWYWGPRVYPSGKFPEAGFSVNEMKNYLEKTALNKVKSGGTKSLTANFLHRALPAAVAGTGSGRIDRIVLGDNSGQIIWAGAPSGGLWKSTNGGTTWSLMNGALSYCGISGIAIHPTNNQIIYIATGDGEARQDENSIGVYKSIDGGATWAATGLVFLNNAGANINALVMDQVNPLVLFAATDNGLKRTTDGGVTWTNVALGDVRDVKINTANSNIIYASNSAGFLKSTNGGATFNVVSGAGLPTSFIRMSIAVTIADPSVVYAVYANNTLDFAGLYRSADEGTTWTAMSTSASSGTKPNLNGQGWYCLAICASPLDANRIYVGGLRVYRSTNGGSTWNGSNGNNSMHVDDHCLTYSPDGTTLFCGNDGGIYKSTNNGSNWTDISFGIQNTQMYHLGVAQSNIAVQMFGAQDNDINIINNNTWDGDNLNADGMDVAISPTNASFMYGASQYGGLNRSTNSGATFSSIKNNVSTVETGAWDTPIELNKFDGNKLLIGFSNLFKTVNGGTNFTKISNWSTTGEINAIEWYPKNENVIYVIRGNKIQLTIDGGLTWSQQPAFGLVAGTLTSIAVSAFDSSRIWVTSSGYLAGKKVFSSTDGGFTFQNISGSLPNVPVNYIYFVDSTQNGLYIGTDAGGVFAIDSTLTDWVPFNQGMPFATVTDIEVHNNTKRVYVATYGRGMWYSDGYSFAKHEYATGGNVGTKLLVAENDFEIYPIPALNNLTIEINEKYGKNLNCFIYDMSGKLIKSKVFNNNKGVVSLDGLSAGNYQLKAEIGNYQLTKSFIKQ